MTTQIFSQTESGIIGTANGYDWCLVDDKFCKAHTSNARDVFGYPVGLRYEYDFNQVKWVYINKGYEECVASFGEVIADYMDDTYN